MNFYLDGWYASRSAEHGFAAEEVADAIRQEAGVEAAVVVQSEAGWGILYIADKPTADFHAAASWLKDGYLFARSLEFH